MLQQAMPLRPSEARGSTLDLTWVPVVEDFAIG